MWCLARVGRSRRRHVRSLWWKLLASVDGRGSRTADARNGLLWERCAVVERAKAGQVGGQSRTLRRSAECRATNAVARCILVRVVFGHLANHAKHTADDVANGHLTRLCGHQFPAHLADAADQRL